LTTLPPLLAADVPKDSVILPGSASEESMHAHFAARILLTALVVLLSAAGEALAGETTLARLSLRMPPERVAGFGAVYREKLAPILKSHGLVESSEKARAAPDGIFSRLFEFETPSKVVEAQEALLRDPALRAVWEEIGIVPAGADWLTRLDFLIYATPAGAGRTVPAGPGKVAAVGHGREHWRSYSVVDGLPTGARSIVQDRDGVLWFGTGGGVSRYDGESFTTFTTDHGLSHNHVRSIVEDREGHLWFGTEGGLSRYDGQSFATFTTDHGLPHNHVQSIVEDREGHLWFCTAGGGVCRYDGHDWTVFTAETGLAGNVVVAACQGREGVMWFGTTRGLSRYDGHTFTTFTTEHGLAKDAVWSIHQAHDGSLWLGTAGGVSRYDGEAFTTYTTVHGLSHNDVRSIVQTPNGRLWFGTYGRGLSWYDEKAFYSGSVEHQTLHGTVLSIARDREGYLWVGHGAGVSRYDGETLATYTTSDGLPHDSIWDLFEDQDGCLWIGHAVDGLSRYDGKTLTTFGLGDGLPGNRVRCVIQDREGHYWIGSMSGGVSRYDGESFTTFTTEDGLARNAVLSILQDREGNFWFGTHAGGISRYDGKTFTTFSLGDGLADSRVRKIIQDREGRLWAGTLGGVSRFDGRTWTTFTAADGPGRNAVTSIYEDRDGCVWVGTERAGVSRYDGRTWTTFTTADGLNHDHVYSILQDRDGGFWFAHWQGGVSRYDGQVFQSLTHQDGLADNGVRAVLQGREGDIWFGTHGGLTRFRPPHRSPPRAMIDAVVADRRYSAISELSVSTSVGLTAFEFRGVSIKTLPGEMVYRYRLRPREEGWITTRGQRVEYGGLPRGSYTFEVQAVDRDLVYSEAPDRVHVTIHPPYGAIALGCGLGLASLVAAVALGYAVRRRRDLFREMQDKLQAAHDLQMGLMPTAPPQIPGLEVEGRCVPADHVGGDFFQYYERRGKLSVVMADVTGHGMDAAIPVVMFSGVLAKQMEIGGEPQTIFSGLNDSMHRALRDRTFVCFAMGEFRSATRTLRLSNAGCPYPYYYCAAAQEITELVVGGYPLGVRPDTEYHVLEVQLEPEDRIVFCSDGIIEAGNAADDQFGYGRTAEAIRKACEEGLSAEETIDRLLAGVAAFRGATPQSDDMACVVVRATQ